MDKLEEKQQLIKFLDGIHNIYNQAYNRRVASNQNIIISDARLMPQVAKDYYKTGVGGKIVRKLTNSVYRNGFIFDNKEHEKIFRKNIFPQLRKATNSMFGYGRGVLVIIENGKHPREPFNGVNLLKDKNVTIRAFDATITNIINSGKDDDVDMNLFSIDFLRPKFYQISNVQVHHSRVIDLTYVAPPDIELQVYEYGGISLFELIQREMKHLLLAGDGVGASIGRSSIPVFKIQNYMSDLAAGKEKFINQMMSDIMDKATYLNGLLIDKEGMEADTLNQTFAGIKEATEFLLRMVSFVTDIPISELVGESVRGLNSTGDNEMSVWNESKANIQETYLIHKINRLMDKLGLEEIEFTKPEQLKAEEKVRIDSGVLDNANKMIELGLDPTTYLKENGFNPEDMGKLENNFKFEPEDDDPNKPKDGEIEES
jgi:phage-related protein (TIGR01555 family)